MTTKKIEFKQQETKAAMMAIEKLGRFAKECSQSGDRFKNAASGEKNLDYKDQQEIFAIASWMEAEFFKKAVEQLKKDIENQTFDF